MRSMLLVLGFPLALAAAGVAADEPSADAAAVVAPAAPVEMAEMADAAGAAPPDVPMDVPMADPMVGEAPAADPAEALEADPWAEAVPAAPAPDAAGAAPAQPGPERTLGAIGYDTQGRQGRIHLVVRGDTLWDISDAYLGSAWVWPSIWRDNRGIDNPHLIYPGDRIWITDAEMRRVTKEEAEALLAGRPAAPAPPAYEEPVPAAPSPRVRTQRVSSREAIGFVTVEEFESAASIVDAVPQRVMLAQGDGVYVGLGEDDTAPGDQFTVFRVDEKVYDPDTGELLGYHVNVLGWLEIQDPHAESSVALIERSLAEIERGDLLIPREPLLLDIPVREAPDGVEGKISYFPGRRTLMAQVDYVYLNRGTLDGIEVGSSLEVYKPGSLAYESVRSERVEIPDRVVAQLLVVRAQPDTAVAYVTHTAEEIGIGDAFRSASSVPGAAE